MLIHFPGLRERKTIAFFYYFPNPNQYLFSPPLLCIAAKMALHSSQSLSIRTALESSRSLPTLGQSHRHLSALLLLLLSRFSRVWLCATPQTAAHQAPCPWDSPGKNTGVGCHFLLQCMKVKSESEVAQSCPILSNPMDYSLPSSSVHGIFQARVLEWGAIAFSSPVQFFWTPWTIAYQASLSMEFSRQEYWSGLPFPSPEDFPNPNEGSNLALLHWR